MQILHTLPRQDGFAMPAEFQRHDGCLMIWPERGDSWRNGAWPARKAFCAVASAIAQTEKLTMLVSAAQYETARPAQRTGFRPRRRSATDGRRLPSRSG